MKAKIVITPKSFAGMMDAANEIFKNYDLEIALNTTGRSYSEAEMTALCRDADGIIVGVDPVTKGVIDEAVKLRAISRYGVGTDNIEVDYAASRGIIFAKTTGANATSVAEAALGLMFAVARGIPYSAAATKSGGWDRLRGVELTGKTAGIVGLGAVGREAARLCKGLGMRVLGYDPYFDNAAYFAASGVERASLAGLFARSDFVSLHVPLSPETENMVNAQLLATMKKSAYIINTARGGLVDEDALYTALRAKRIAGAASDVFSSEPPEAHRLLGLDNFILTAHIGAYTFEANKKMALMSAQNLMDMLFG